MEDVKRRRLEEIVKRKKETTKRTTIILDKEEREFIDSLILEGKETGIKSFISKMINVYRNLMIYDWRFPGEYYCGISRVALVNVEMLNVLMGQMSKEKLGETGKRIGAVLKISMEATLGLKTAQLENWQEVFDRLKVQGFGNFYLKDKYILIKTPFVSNAEIWEGILEELLETELETKIPTPPLVFELKTKRNLSKK